MSDLEVLVGTLDQWALYWAGHEPTVLFLTAPVYVTTGFKPEVID